MLERLRLLFQSGQLDQALELCRSSQDADLRYALPTVHLKKRDRPVALASIRVLLRAARDPWDALGLCRLGALAAEVGDFRLATRCLKRALELDQSATAPRRVLTAVYRRQATDSKIPEILAPLFTRPPVPAWALHEMASCRAEEGDTEAALRFFQAAKDAFGLHQAAEILRRRGDLEDARRLEVKALDRDPVYPWSRWRRACDAARAHRWKEALEELGRARSLPTEQLKACWLDRQGQTRKARELRLQLLPAQYRELYDRRLELIEEGAVEWHGLGGRHALATLTVRWAGERPDLQPFLERWLPGLKLKALPAQVPARPYGELEQAVVSGNDRWLARQMGVPAPREEEGEVLLAVLEGENPWRATRGFGGYNLALVERDPRDRWSDTTVLHELLHAAFGLGHTDGIKGPLDPLGVMGHQGSSTHLDDAYLDLRQQCHLASPLHTGHLVQEVWSLESRGRLKEARAALEAVVKADPLHLWARSRLAWTRLRAGQTAEAFQLLELPRSVGWGADPDLLRSRFLLHQGEDPRLEEAAGYGRCLRTCVLAGSARAAERHFSEARFDYALALGLDATAPHARLATSCCEAAQGHLRGAQKELDRLLRKNPAHAAALRRAAIVAARLQQYRKARQLLAVSRPLQRESSDQAYCEGVVAWLEGHHQQATRRFKRALLWRQDCIEARYHLAYSALCLGRWQSAGYHFQRVAGQGGPAFPARCARAALDWLQGLDPELCPLLDRDPREASLWALLLLQAWRSKKSTARARQRLARLEARNPLFSKDFTRPFQNEFQDRQGEARGP